MSIDTKRVEELFHRLNSVKASQIAINDFITYIDELTEHLKGTTTNNQIDKDALIHSFLS